MVVNFFVGFGLAPGFSQPEGLGFVMKEGSVVTCQCIVFRLLGLDIRWAGMFRKIMLGMVQEHFHCRRNLTQFSRLAWEEGICHLPVNKSSHSARLIRWVPSEDRTWTNTAMPPLRSGDRFYLTYPWGMHRVKLREADTHGKKGQDLSLPSLVWCMLADKSAWSAMVDFCESVKNTGCS